MIILIRSNSPERRLQAQLELGSRYLEELDYDHAIAAFEAAIEIDPRNAESYLGLVDAYAGLGDAEALIGVYNRAQDQLLPNDLIDINEHVAEIYIEWIESAIAEGDFERVESLIGYLESIDKELAKTYKNYFINTISDNSVKEETVDGDSVDSFYLVQSDETTSTGYSYTLIYNYSEEGYSITRTDNGRNVSYEEYYDINGGILYSTSVSDGFYVENGRWEYDERGNCLYGEYTQMWLNVSTGEWGPVNITMSYEYESNGNRTLIYGGDFEGGQYYQELDDKGNIIRSEGESNGQLNTIIYSYDCRGNLVHSKESLGGYETYFVNTYSDGVVLSYEHPDI